MVLLKLVPAAITISLLFGLFCFIFLKWHRQNYKHKLKLNSLLRISHLGLGYFKYFKFRFFEIFYQGDDGRRINGE